jgi:tetratricopeptide (TPR) repeat protein
LENASYEARKIGWLGENVMTAYGKKRSLFEPQSSRNLVSFEKAVEADPDYAMAWGWLATARSLSVIWQPTEEASSSTINAYERALGLDPDESEALAAKAWMTQLLQGDWEAAGKLYQRAVATGENTTATTTYAIFYLLPIERISDAIRLYADAEKRDPLRAGYKANLAILLLWSGDAEAAIRKAREALELKPQHLFAVTALTAAYRFASNCPAAVEFLQGLPIALQQQPRIRLEAALCYTAQGDFSKAREIYRDVVENTPLYGGILQAAQLALRLGEVEEAIDLMERAIEDKSWQQFFLKIVFRNDYVIKDHPRYLALLKRIGLDDESVAELHRKLSFD